MGLMRSMDTTLGIAAPHVPTPRDERVAFLRGARVTLIAYMRLKADAEDWHGVQNAASDLRDLDNELDGLTFG